MTKIFYVNATWSGQPVPQQFGVAADNKTEAGNMVRDRLKCEGRVLIDISHSKIVNSVPRSQHEWEHGTTLHYGDTNRHE